MASLGFSATSAASGRVFAATSASKSTGGSSEEKGLLEWILGGLQKQGQLFETDPILQKEEEKSSGSGNGTSRKTNSSISVPKKKSGGSFGGLFAKK